MIEAIAHERPQLATIEPFTAEQRVIRSRTEAVVVDRRTDQPQIICASLEIAEDLANIMNLDARAHAAQVWP